MFDNKTIHFIVSESVKVYAYAKRPQEPLLGLGVVGRRSDSSDFILFFARPPRTNKIPKNKAKTEKNQRIFTLRLVRKHKATGSVPLAVRGLFIFPTARTDFTFVQTAFYVLFFLLLFHFIFVVLFLLIFF